MSGLIVSEASLKVGYGHLMECLAIADAFPEKNKIDFSLIQSDTNASKLVRDNGYNVSIYSNKTEKYDWILLNTRKNEYTMQCAFSEKTDRLVVFDELGDLQLKCYALINFNINKEWYKYFGDNLESVKFYLGFDYYPLRNNLRKIKQCGFTKGKVLVSLGGADRSATVLRVAELLKKYEGECTYVLGPGCSVSREDLREIDCNHNIVVAPDNFDALLGDCEFLISAGGNTLYEAASLKTKSLVIWEDEHERIQGELFEKAGSAVMIGNSYNISENKLYEVLSGDFKFSFNKITVDGDGSERICKVIKNV